MIRVKKDFKTVFFFKVFAKSNAVPLLRLSSFLLSFLAQATTALCVRLYKKWPSTWLNTGILYGKETGPVHFKITVLLLSEGKN